MDADSCPWQAETSAVGHLLSQLSRMPRNDLVVCICAAIKTALDAAVASQAGDKRKRKQKQSGGGKSAEVRGHIAAVAELAV